MRFTLDMKLKDIMAANPKSKLAKVKMLGIMRAVIGFAFIQHSLSLLRLFHHVLFLRH